MILETLKKIEERLKKIEGLVASLITKVDALEDIVYDE